MKSNNAKGSSNNSSAVRGGGGKSDRDAAAPAVPGKARASAGKARESAKSAAAAAMVALPAPDEADANDVLARGRGEVAAIGNAIGGTNRASSEGTALLLSVLHETLQSLAQAAPRQETLTLLTHKAQILTRGESAALALLEADRETLHFVAVAGDVATGLRGTRARAENTFLGQTAQTGQSVLTYRPVTAHLASAAVPDDLSPLEDAMEHPLSAAVVPIFAGGTPIGALAVLNKADQRPFSGDDLLSLSTLAAIAGIAMGQAQLREDRERQGRELSLLYEAVRSVSGKLSVQEILQTLVEQTGTQLDTGVVVVLLANDERTHLYIAEEHGLDNESREMTFGTASRWGRTLLAATRPLFFSFNGADDARPRSAETDDTTPAVAPNVGTVRLDFAGNDASEQESPFPHLRTRGGLAAPIRIGDRTLGAVLALSQEPNAYSLADANLLSALASQSAVALENAGLYEEATRRADEAIALYELSQAVNSSLRLRDVLDRVADATLRLLDVDKFALFLRAGIGDDFDADGANGDGEGDSDGRQRLLLEVQRGLSPDARARLRPFVGEGVPGWVVQYETPAAVQDVAADARNRALPLHKEGVTSLVCMPLQTGGETLGVLCAMSAHRRLFTIGEAELLFTIANQVAIAIENARVYAAARRRGRELRRSFHRIAKMLGAARSPQEAIALVAQLTRDMLGADRCTIYEVASSASAANADDATTASDAVSLALTTIGNAAIGADETSADTSPSPLTLWIARRHRLLRIENIALDERFPQAVANGPESEARGAGALEQPDRSTSAKSGKRARALAAAVQIAAAAADAENAANKDSAGQARDGNGAYLGVPLRQGREIVGVFEVYARAPRLWRNEDLRLLLTFASQAVVALRNLRLTQQNADATERADRLEYLLRRAAQTNGVFPDDLTEKIAAALRAETAAIAAPTGDSPDSE